MSLKKFIVDLSDEERRICLEIVKKLKGTSQKVKRANILLKADRGWTDARIAEAFDCRANTVENLRKRFVEMGFGYAQHGRELMGCKSPVRKRESVRR